MNPIRLPPGVLIDKPGQYDIPMDVYHGQPCIGPSVSSSGLRKIYLESPADFWAFSDLNDDRFEREETDAFVFGRAAHALLLGDDDFMAKFAVVPASAPARPLQSQILARIEGRISKSAEERFEFWDPFEAQHAGKTFLSENDLDHIRHIRDALEAHPIVPLLLEGQAEQSLIWQDERTGLWLKSRLDMLSATGDLVDLKSTAFPEPRKLVRSVTDHGYRMQLGLATMALENVLGVPFTPEAYAGRSAILIFISKKPPYHVAPIEVSFDALHWGRLECRKAIDTMAECIRTGHWPGPVEGVLTYDVPEWQLAELSEKQASGLFPTSV
jgi:hypothetical protein